MSRPRTPGGSPGNNPGGSPGRSGEPAPGAAARGEGAGQAASAPGSGKSRLPKGSNALRSRPVRSGDRLRFALADRLTVRDRAIAHAVARHRVLTTPQLERLFFGSHSAAAHRLLDLHRLGVLERFRPLRDRWGAHPWHWMTGPLGSAVLAAERGEDPDAAARRWRGERALALAGGQRLAHLVGVNDFYASLAGRARHTPYAALSDWLTEHECAAWTEGIVRPDAWGVWGEAGRAVEFFLEYDRGTETLARLAAKLAGYERLEAERGATAWVVFAFTSARREARARAALAAATVPVATGALEAGAPPHEALWRPVGSDGPRLRLAALDNFAKPEQATARAARGGPRAWRFDRSRPDDMEEAPMD